MSTQQGEKKGHRRWVPVVILAVVAVLLLRYIPTNFLPPSEKGFSLTASDCPDTLRVGETLEIEATLSYPHTRSFLATTGNFIVYIAPCYEGEKAAGYPLVAKYAYLPASGSFSQEWTFTPSHTGTCVVKIFADFDIGGKSYRLTLPDQTILVTE